MLTAKEADKALACGSTEPVTLALGKMASDTDKEPSFPEKNQLMLANGRMI